MKIDLYFSYRSPYSFLILPRMLELKEKYEIEINFKVVYPLAIRKPEFFDKKGLPYFLALSIDANKKARRLGMSFTTKLKPDPIVQNTVTGKIAKNQPYIFDICHLGQMAQIKGVGIEFAFEVSLQYLIEQRINHKNGLPNLKENYVNL